MLKKIIKNNQIEKTINGGNSQQENNINPKQNKTDYQMKNINSKSYFQLILTDTQYIYNNSINKLDSRILVI